ncbi:hypothetical protein ES703_76336 [subsurface metagenome]
MRLVLCTIAVYYAVLRSILALHGDCLTMKIQVCVSGPGVSTIYHEDNVPIYRRVNGLLNCVELCRHMQDRCNIDGASKSLWAINSQWV